MTTLIIGSRSDSHVVSVLEAMRMLQASEPLVLDGPALRDHGFSLTLDTFTHRGRSIDLSDQESSGWLRRYAPSAWGTGSVAGSLEAVSKRAFLGLVGAITRIGGCRWLTPLDAMLNAEDRIVQLKIAQQLGIHVPETIVTSSSIEATQLLGPRFVVKPLVGGYYWTEEGPRAVFTSAMDESEASTLDFGSAPFVAQEMLLAKTHLRVVTVGEEAWVSSLDAEGRPLDWREQDEAHFSWAVVDDKQACKHALRLAKALGVGYSSQDWISDGNDLTFLDLNPGGQWLFLPDPLAQRVTEGVARFLCGGR